MLSFLAEIVLQHDEEAEEGKKRAKLYNTVTGIWPFKAGEPLTDGGLFSLFNSLSE